jgi:hypothetical protein
MKDEVKPNPQKIKWNEKSRFSNYEEADTLRNNLKSDGYELVKVKRCGPDGTLFKVVTGTEIKRNKKVKTKKENKNASR